MWLHLVLVLLAAAAAGAVNAVAGGGTLLTFPSLLAYGLVARAANATSTVALWPGTASSLWGYRDELTSNRRILLPFVFFGAGGGALGAYLLLVTPTEAFDRIVPFLILAATVLLVAQEPISRWIRSRSDRPEPTPSVPAADGSVDEGQPVAAVPVEPVDPEDHIRLTPGTLLLILLTGVYGGYFGAGIGIITLAALSLVGMRHIHRMNAIKNVFALFTNGVAAAIFIFSKQVDWRLAGLMAIGSIFGGYAGAGLARRIGQKNVRRIIVAIGVLLTVKLFLH